MIKDSFNAMWVGIGSWLREVLLLSLVFMGSNAHADWADFVRQMRTDTYTWRIRIVDESGHPIPAATVWEAGSDVSPGFNQAFMERMVRRYAMDADFVQYGSSPGGFQLLRASLDGRLSYTDTCICETRYKTRVFAGIKRGYISKVITVTASKNSPVDVTIALQPDPDAKVDQRMLEFDRLVAGAQDRRATRDPTMQQENMAFDRAVNKKIRALAQALEQDNQPDLASALYYNLAFMSAVESIVMPDGQEKLIGYSFDYVPSNPQRKADYDKAFALNLSTPHLSHFKFRTKAEPQADADADRLARLRARVSDGEREFALYGERLWPSDYWLTYSYTNLGMFDKACEWLKRIREFEPTALRDTGGRIGSWDMELQLLNDAATRANFAGEQCKY